VFQWRHSVLATCTAVLACSALLYIPTGLLGADPASLGIGSRLQLIGLLLLFVLLPMWMLSCFLVTQRHSLSLARQVEQAGPVAEHISAEIIRLPRRQILLGLGGGLVYALALNVPVQQFGAVARGEWPVIGFFLGQIALWICVGFLLAIRLHVANLFHRLGATVEFSIFEQSRLEAFARVGMLDVAIIVGGMALATVQSLDAHFRLENYLSAFLVAVPAAAALLMRPMWSLHRRLAERKAALLEDINALIAAAPEDGRVDSLQRLEPLLQSRDRVKALHTWPLDLAIWSRLFLYVLIPPIAWVGSAVVEAVVGRMLGN
jgi:hypothetical protein